MTRDASSIVIPAHAGIHVDFEAYSERRIKLDPGLRRDDGIENT